MGCLFLILLLLFSFVCWIHLVAACWMVWSSWLGGVCSVFGFVVEASLVYVYCND